MMKERRAVLLLVLGLGLAAAAGLGLAFETGPALLLKALAVVGVLLAFGGQHRMFRLPEK